MRCWLQISSGRGPEECCWVVAQLTRYLLNLGQEEKIAAELLEAVPGDTAATMRSALIALEKDESLENFIARWTGTVQWIGKSMFRARHKRKNWFVSVTSFQPVEPNELGIANIRVETMRSSGPGGQHVNKTESAIRVTDTTTGISAIAQEERSQYLNKKLALARLHQLKKQMNNQAHQNFDQRRWQQHNSLERGNAIRVFEGLDFNLKK